MADYWVTFRIADDASYQKRYQSLLEAMIAARGASWAEPTSFWLVNSDLGISALAKKLSASLIASKDLLVVCELARNSSVYFGSPEHLDILREFLPNIKKVA